MKTVMLAMMLALTALSVALSSALATDPNASKPTQTAPTEMPAASETKGVSAAQDSNKDGRRGQLEDIMSLCDVAPPCPSGCSVDAASRNKCVEWPRP
jgi:hypothetical protein